MERVFRVYVLGGYSRIIKRGHAMFRRRRLYKRRRIERII
jgi:hypothetical protein